MLARIPKGLLVAVEGIDGAGKTTFCALAAQYFGERGVGCVVSKEPTSGQWGMELRRSAKEGRLSLEDEVELFIKDRREHVGRFIQPALDEGLVVLLDRYYFSSAAYQGARGADPDEIMRRNEEFAPAPDLLLLFDLSPDTGMGRIAKRGDSPNEFETDDGLTRSREIFLALDHPAKRVVNGSAPMLDVLAEALVHLREVLVSKVGEAPEDPRLRAAVGGS